MKYIFAAALGRGAKYGKNAAHIGYELDKDCNLVQRGIDDDVKGGLMVLTLRSPNLRSFSDAAADIALELAQREYSGLIADTECGYDKSVEALLRQLERAGIAPIYVEQCYAKAITSAKVMISSAVRGGAFDAVLTKAQKEYGQRVVLQLARLCEDSPLPCREDAGKVLSPSERADLQRQSGAQGFYSPKLMTNYFTYYDSNKTAHFVLYDTSSSIKRKMELASKHGFSETIIAPEQFEDIWSEIC